jgi:hypothetical protein
MRIQVKNFRGIVDLDAEVAPLLLLAGSNAAGKTSACLAIAAVASGDLLPFAGLTKKSAGLLVRDGAADASATLIAAGGAAHATWPAVERRADGRAPDCSPVAVGIEDLTALKPIDRAARLITFINALPTEDDAAAALTDAGFDEASRVAIWTNICNKGWDSAHAHYKDENTKLKGSWEQIAGEKYGAVKAATWRPKGWPIAHEQKTLEQLAADGQDAEAAYEDMQRQAGADQAQIARLKADADKLPAAQKAAREAKDELETMQRDVIAATAAMAALGARPELDAPPMACPCCKADLRVIDGRLAEAGIQDVAAITAAIAAYDAAETKLAKAASARDFAKTYSDAADRKVKEAQAALDELRQLPPSGEVPKEKIDAAAAALTECRNAYSMKKRIIEALQLHERIQRRAILVDLLDKDGLRQKVLARELGAFNGRLAQLSETAGWKVVRVEDDMSITFGGRLLSLCSAGEQFRARVIVQLAVARSEGAPLVVIDGADILDRDGRNGLFRTLHRLGQPAVVGMTILREADVPDLAKAGMGESIWIEAGRVRRATAKEAA